MMLDSMMPLDDGLITKYSPIKIATNFNLNSSGNPKSKTLFYPFLNNSKFKKHLGKSLKQSL
jgi:hypothetical protein